MDGIALALATARDHPAIIILLMTAYADQRERASNLDALIHDVILKPFTLAEIKAAVSDALRHRQALAPSLRMSFSQNRFPLLRDMPALRAQKSFSSRSM